MTWALDAAAVCAVVGAAAGLGIPTLIARIPEPVDPAGPGSPGPGSPGPRSPAPGTTASSHGRDPQREDDVVLAAEPVAVTTMTPAKEPYVSIAGTPGLSAKAVVASGVAAGLVGLALGWQWTLLPLLVLVPVGVALAVVDWRTRLLPTKVILPSYAVVGLLAAAAAALADDWPSLVRALWGLVLARGTFWLLWLVYPRGMGFGDVRLAGVLGLALGLLGWGQLTLGIYAGFVLGGVGGLVLSMARVVDRGAYPFGPFMLLGALVGVVLGGEFTEIWLGRL